MQGNFTKQFLQSLKAPASGRLYVADTREKGLSVYVTSSGIITFFVRKRINRRDERVVIGRFPEMTIEQARTQALAIKAQIAQGKDPIEDKRRMRSEITFFDMFHGFMERYSKKHKRSWRYDEREVNKFLSHWFKRKASTITKQEIQLLHERIRDKNGLYQANRILERISAIFNRAIEWGWQGENPAHGIRKFREKSRDRFLQPDELPRFFAALEAEENQTARDFLMLSLLTGARKSNVLAMRWDEIHFERAEWRIPETKNGDPLTIPLSLQAIEILDRRRQGTNSEWVFAVSGSTSGHLADPKKAWQRVLARAGIKDLRIHDLRRSLGSWQASTGASSFVIGKSLGHKSQQATQIYARLNLDPVRESVERATQAMMAAGKSDRTGKEQSG
ncbi:MAG: tyrosine-type recombinase/integrase [Rhodospirillales bacterium]|nr:tyrosine-type recombinase/integrase [Rhodospirillales bacterium]